MHQTSSILQKIAQKKHEEIALGKKKQTIAQLKSLIQQAQPTRQFTQCIQNKRSLQQVAVVAEIKKASPSQGVIRSDFKPDLIAKDYAKAGACCLSVLTDSEFFQGCKTYLQVVKQACDLPVLRKDFILDVWQIYESRVMGADCILLIAALLNDDQLKLMSQLAFSYNMDVLIEIHNEDELQRVLPIKHVLIGINNRNLHTFSVTLETTFKLLPLIPEDRIVITESGIKTKEDVDAMVAKKVSVFLVGEAFMKCDKPGEALQRLFY